MKEMSEGMDKMLQELGVDKDSLVSPSGPVGIAIFTTRDPELDTPKPAFILTADYGDDANAEKTDSIVQAALAKGEKEGDLEFEQKDVNGKSVYTIDFAKMAAKSKDAEKDFDDIDMDGGMPLPVPKAGEIVKDIEKLHYVRDGHHLLMSTDFNTLAEALDTVDGKAANGNHAADRTEFQAIMGKVGEADFYGVLLTRDVFDLIGEKGQMAKMMLPTIRSLFGEVKGYGFGLRFDGPTAMVEQTLTAYLPGGKQGLTKLVDLPAARLALPAFIGPDSVSYSTFSFKFSGLMDVIRQAVASNPMLAAQAGEEIDAIAPKVNEITATLGTQVHMCTSVTKPFTDESRHSFFAIECTKPQDFENLIAPYAAQAGIEARDLLGQRIYSLPEDMALMPVPGMDMGPMSLGIGGGFIVIGSTPAVEQALRATGQSGAASLFTEPDYQRAAAALKDANPIAWGYSDTISSLESTIEAQKHSMRESMKQMEETMRDMDDEDAESAKHIKDYMQRQMDSMKIWDDIDFNLLRQHIGPQVWQVLSNDDGFVVKAYLMAAKKADN
jgi:hypothetical protein